MGEEEQIVVKRVLESGILSKFLGCWHTSFYGGPEVQALEKEWAAYFGVKNAIAVNSATSGIFCAVGAIGVGPGDEVIVSPYTMTASAVAPLIYNAIPVFADIEADYYCLSPESIEKNITDRTKAIIIVDLFGQPYDVKKVNEIAKKYNIFVIEDCAQAPGAQYENKWTGKLGDVGVFSLNYHKHIQTGEGGVIVTDNDEIAERLRLIRNHAEAVIEAKGYNSLVNMLGFNYRMTEVEAAIGREQLKKLDSLLQKRIENVEYLTEGLSKIPCIIPAKIRTKCRHVFYLHSLMYDKRVAGIHRDRFVEAVKSELMPTELRESEGVKIGTGYVKPLYLQPLYQTRIAFGDGGCPWNCEKYGKVISYTKGICPTAERLYEDELITHELITPSMSMNDLDDVIRAFQKVWEYREELQ